MWRGGFLELRFRQPGTTRTSCSGFLRAGSMTLDVEGHPEHRLTAGDAFVLPPRLTVGIRETSNDLEILEVALPAGFSTHVL